MTEKYLLALDVGTRKVTGILLEKEGNNFEILAVDTREHKTRAMLDGQIHDIPRVAQVVLQVKTALEEKADRKLYTAAVAAAGRSLCTVRARAQMQFSPAERLGHSEVLRLEYAAVHRAQQELFSGPAGKVRFAEQYHCVGYSVIRYILDDSPIGNLFGQRGASAACEVIATFLPRVVVDSLRSVLEMAGLKLQSLTLEPIAALRMVVPEGMRKLNVALVDIGAGTSDIAITRDDAVFAYDMVPVAGDEITEALCEAYLLDFMSAEEVKRRLNKTGKIAFTNVLGEKITADTAEIKAATLQALDMLTEKIANAILDKNGGTPQAVFCVGGGSLTHGLTAMLAEKTGMDPARVTIKGKEMTGLLPGKQKLYQGPELVTPLGIAYTSNSGDALRFYRVNLNNQPVDVMDLGRGRVADVLLAAGIGARELVGPPGKGLTLEVNGQIVTIPGGMGKMAEIQVNGYPAALEDAVAEGDAVSFVAARPGEEARASTAALLARLAPFQVTVNGEVRKLQPPVYRNDELLPPEAELYDRDRLRVLKTMPLERVLQSIGLERELDDGSIRITVNGAAREIPYGPKAVLVNGRPAVAATEVAAGDEIQLTSGGVYPDAGCLTPARSRIIEVNVNGRILTTPVKDVVFSINGKQARMETMLQDGDIVEIRESDYDVSMADILHLMDFQASPPVGKNRLILKVNGREAQFTTLLKHGDRLEIGWTA